MSEEIDVVNRPQHYGDIFAVRHTQCRAIARLLNFDAGCCWKYVWRAAKKECKEDPKQDLKKIALRVRRVDKVYAGITRFKHVSCQRIVGAP